MDGRRELARAAGSRAALLGLGWLVLTGGDPGGLAWGLPIVAAATGVSLALGPPAAPIHAVGLARFAAAFAVGSLTGGLDVAWRALSPRLPLAPTILRHPLRTPPGPARNLFMGALNLMPGTLALEVEERCLNVHVLVDRARVRRSLAAFEARAAAVYGVPLEEPGAGAP